jgi:NAD(P)-dependent dehydrogenase (short-subunit alcohol dehydrogenase family)
MRMAGRYAIVTGASQGLGQAIAERFVGEGASVLVCARGEEAILRAGEVLAQAARIEGQRVIARRIDMADPAQVDDLVRGAQDEFGRIDILVNNAGIYGPIGPTHEVNWEHWVESIQINLLGLVRACRAATPLMIGQGYGRIVNISGGGATNPLPRLTSYAASKAAVVRFTESLALELAEYGITVNAVAPGALATRMTQQLLDAGPDKAGEALHKRIGEIARQGGTPVSLGAELVASLASAESAGITGRLIAAQWDPWRSLHDRADELGGSDIYTLRRIIPSDRGCDWDV